MLSDKDIGVSKVKSIRVPFVSVVNVLKSSVLLPNALHVGTHHDVALTSSVTSQIVHSLYIFTSAFIILSTQLHVVNVCPNHPVV